MIVFLCSALPSLGITCCIQTWGSQHKKGFELLELVQRGTTKMLKGLKHLSYEKRLKELGLFHLVKALGWPCCST